MEKKNKEPLILIVDDNPANIRLLEIILKREKYKTTTAKSGSEAIRIAKEEQPDLIFLDVMMPGLDGYQVCNKLKNFPDTAHIPIIFLTSKSDSDDIVKGFECGAADYVTKPFKQVELSARLKTHLQLKKSNSKIVELEKTNLALAMAATTNHEINQPLTVLTGNLYLLRSSLPGSKMSKEQHHYFEMMDTAVMKIKKLLAKYRGVNSVRYQKYAGDSRIVVFDDEKDSGKEGTKE